VASRWERPIDALHQQCASPNNMSYGAVLPAIVLRIPLHENDIATSRRRGRQVCRKWKFDGGALKKRASRAQTLCPTPG
jgi:hypothetical protein